MRAGTWLWFDIIKGTHNRQIVRAVSNNYTAGYLDLLSSSSMKSIVETVYHRRLLLAHKYSRRLKHQPTGTFTTYQGNRPRRLCNGHSLYVSPRSDRSVTDSYLGVIATSGNGLPAAMANMTHHQLWNHLRTECTATFGTLYGRCELTIDSWRKPQLMSHL